MTFDPLAAHATALLLASARGDHSAAQAYRNLIFPELRLIVRHRPQVLLAYARRLTGQAGLTVPAVAEQDLDDLASDVTIHALQRALRTANRFDPARGDGFGWALGATALSYLDLVRRKYGTRRRVQEVLVDDEQFAQLEADLPTESSLEEHAEQRERLDEALAALSEAERYVIIAKLHYGLSYVEIAEYHIGDSSEVSVRRVDRLLQQARTKLRAAEARAAAGASAQGEPFGADGP